MLMMASSRLYNLTRNGVTTLAHVPYADMFNHSSQRKTTYSYDEAREGYTVSAVDEIKRGEPVCISYGDKCNTRFLLNYGFVN